mgnify:CR=1 FL=1
MYLNKLINNPELIKVSFKKLETSSKVFSSIYKNKIEISEENIMENYKGLLKYSRLVSNLKTLSSLNKKLKFEKIVASLDEGLFNISENLDYIAKSLEPEDYKENLDYIKNYLKRKNFNIGQIIDFIYPYDDKIIIGTSILINDRFLVFTSIYSCEGQTQYLNYLSDCFPGSYDLGIEIKDDYDKVLDSYLLNKPLDRIDTLIKNSEIFNNFIKASVVDKVDTKKAFNAIVDYFKDYLDKSYLYNTDMFLRFKNNLKDADIKTIAKILKLKNNDTYKLIALQKE